MLEFSAEKLATFDGLDGRPAYVAYEGVVYDVSDSEMWADGEHVGMHAAGRDLTVEQEDAPHDAYIKDYPVVGRLV